MNQCVAAGPQAPRDISKHEGNNKVLFSPTPELAKMHLCNVHFHRFAEHRASAYSIFVEDGEFVAVSGPSGVASTGTTISAIAAIPA